MSGNNGPRHDVTIDNRLIGQINDVTIPPMKALNEAVTARWPMAPDMYLALAIAWQVSLMLGNLSKPEEVLTAVDGMNAILTHTGFALRAIS